MLMFKRASSRDISNTFFIRPRRTKVIVIIAIDLSDDWIYAGLCSIKPSFKRLILADLCSKYEQRNSMYECSQ